MNNWLQKYSEGGKISKTGYKRTSKDKDEPMLTIPSNNITMEGVTHPVYGVDNEGNSQMMFPGENYQFPGQYVNEIPVRQQGGPTNLWQTNKPEWADSITSSLIQKGYQWPKNTFNPYTDDQSFDSYETNNHPNDTGYYVFPSGMEQQGINVNGETQKDFFIEQMYKNKERMSPDAVKNAFGYKKQDGGEKDPTSWMSEGIQPTSLPKERERAYRGRTQKRVNRSTYLPHPLSPKMQKGGSKDHVSTDEVPTRNYIPDLPPLNQDFINYSNIPQSHVNTSPERKGTISKAATIVRNPLTALQYKAKGQPIPDYLEHGERNNFDNAVDVINPMTYIDAAARTASLKHFRDEGFSPDAITKTLLDAGMVYGIGNEFELGSTEVANPLGNKIEANIPIQNRALELDRMRGPGIKLAWQKGKLTPEQWSEYNQAAKNQWIETPREPIKVPTVGLKQAKTFRVPQDNNSHAGIVNETGFFPLIEEPSGVINSSEMNAKIQDAISNNKRILNSNLDDYIKERNLLNPFVNYNLQTIEHANEVIPGVNYNPQLQQNGQSASVSTYQPYTPQPAQQSAPVTAKSNKITQKKQVQQPIPVQDTVQETPQEQQRRIEWLHSHNGEEPILDSSRVVSTFQEGGDPQSNIDYLNSLDLTRIKELQNQQHIDNTPYVDPKYRALHENKRTQILEQSGLDDNGERKPLTNLMYDKHWQGLADNIVNPMVQMYGYDQLANVAKEGFVKFMQNRAAKQAVEEIPSSYGFPLNTIKNTKGTTGMPTLTEPTQLNKEQEILQRFGLDPNKTRIPDGENHISMGNWDPTTTNPWSYDNITKSAENIRPKKLDILGNDKLSPLDQFNRIEFANKMTNQNALETLSENANTHQDIMNNPEFQKNIQELIQERRMRNTLFPGKSDNGLINSLKNHFAMEDDDVIRALDNYNPSSKATRYKSSAIDDALKQFNEQSNHYDLLAPKNKPNTFPIKETVGFQDGQAKYFSSQPSNEQLIENNSWADKVSWKDFGKEMRGSMKQMNLDPNNEQEVEIFKRLHKSNIQQRSLDQYKPAKIDVFNDMSQQKLGGENKTNKTKSWLSNY